ncbi:nucleotidyltransferase domain-containing protein [Streptacidiphilus cavernicola]|uniref:Nucleotidyltransferase domain-containing protein n=1 Tax=Streptacidiphilus cavernicola TaxID=3342716 RepID=A0ABV6W6E0_9ACTN
MKRERATALMAEMVDRLEGGAWPLGLVKEVYVFGSYARGALNPGDVDVVVQHGTDEKWLQESLHASVYGSDSHTSMKQVSATALFPYFGRLLSA